MEKNFLTWQKKVWTKKYTLQGKTFEIVSSLCSLWDEFKALVTFIPLEASLSLYKLTRTKKCSLFIKMHQWRVFSKINFKSISFFFNSKTKNFNVFSLKLKTSDKNVVNNLSISVASHSCIPIIQPLASWVQTSLTRFVCLILGSSHFFFYWRNYPKKTHFLIVVKSDPKIVFLNYFNQGLV